MNSEYQPIARPNVAFEMRSIAMPGESLEAGRPVYRDAEFVIFRVPGDKNTIVEKEVTDAEVRDWKRTPHKEHVPALYESWKSGLDSPVNGTALKDWPSIAPGQVHQALTLGIRTVEDFASLSEEGQRNFGFGARELKKKANVFLEYGNNQGQVVEKVAHQEMQLENQNTLIKELQEKMAELESAKKAAEKEAAAKAKPPAKEAAAPKDAKK